MNVMNSTKHKQRHELTNPVLQAVSFAVGAREKDERAIIFFLGAPKIVQLIIAAPVFRFRV